ncbi:MAG: helix-turn-helix domain-containing protein [Caulobacteraceae bacterium]
MNTSQKINMIRRDMTFMDFSDSIYKKTGVFVHYTTLQKYVTGKRSPALKTLKAIADYANVPVSWFYEESDECSCEEMWEISRLIRELSPESISELKNYISYLKYKDTLRKPSESGE